jgi:peptidoglycan hydrolase-like protein with peptidoglycan-binding domain
MNCTLLSFVSQIVDWPGHMPTLRLGNQGDFVIILQQYLYRTGHYDGSIDGNFDLKTYDSIRELQKQVGIFPRGDVDRKTWQAIICLHSLLECQRYN